ncbi:class I SAM-dependent methyltransferase [Candidatus Venteria ishoeyi]|uniref:class I SAM-dependent methyltransferase n=1 Tax=Candidatus Venteria ishoeyi TaxID=1899563 RepID=UPI0025A656C7|nr:class I SAM-dependent methyltransferase [Candidatus Venteria ishoeyi]MDM8546309.1 class I SAM-dependent methyltransferase [Candidatus Venteria ishoeyi]
MTTEIDKTSSSALAAQTISISPQKVSVAYDEYLLELSKAQWQFGDWESLAQLDVKNLESHPDRAVLALLAATGLFQVGEKEKARQYVFLTQKWGCPKQQILKMLASGVYINLGHVATVEKNQNKASGHNDNAKNFFILSISQKYKTQLKTLIEPSQLMGVTNLPEHNQIIPAHIESSLKLEKNKLELEEKDKELEVFEQVIKKLESEVHQVTKERNSKTALINKTNNIIKQRLLKRNENKELWSVWAEMAIAEGSYPEAIRRFQNIISAWGIDTPQNIYQRLDEAYIKTQRFPAATDKEESVKGDMDKYELLGIIHNIIKPRFYFEIGVQTGKSLSLAKCEAIGIDPMPHIKETLDNQAIVITASSDNFFKHNAQTLLSKSPDLVFIDGMHLFEFALRDFMNVEYYSASGTVVVIDDIYPGHATQAERCRVTRNWTGDIWKFYAILSEYRSDLFVLTLDANPTGLLLITGLDSNNRVLSEHYDEIVERYTAIESAPQDIVERRDVVSCHSKNLNSLLQNIYQSRQDKYSRQELLDNLKKSI